jgi:hypothetical protein
MINATLLDWVLRAIVTQIYLEIIIITAQWKNFLFLIISTGLEKYFQLSYINVD